MHSIATSYFTLANRSFEGVMCSVMLSEDERLFELEDIQIIGHRMLMMARGVESSLD